MYKNTSTVKIKIYSGIKRIIAWSVLFTAALLPWRLRVLFCGLLHKINYIYKGKDIVGERVNKFFFE